MGASNPAWKKTEREVARVLGGRRRWLSRAERAGGGDIDHPRLEVEVKHTPTLGFRAARAVLSKMPPGPKVRVVVHRAKRAKGADAWRCYLDLGDLWRLCALRAGWSVSAGGEAAVVWERLREVTEGCLVSLSLEDLARLVGSR